ncbi:hypothetical protein [Polluticoccus soli]|uniref:hypothetical protein n=1 Tax=Polluticoccus soli TaxID=3034150 RepID=UPI0023E2DF7C|nr:hypothetical protein [Flavipsychrobacter sp. JY13-12]
MKKVFAHGVIAGVLAALAGGIYLTIYKNTLEVSFDQIVNIPSIAGSCVFATMLIAGGYAVLLKTNKLRFSGWYNVAVAVISFATIIGPISMSLPLDIESPEMFPGLIVPMHFFPALAYFTIAPLFNYPKA